MTVPIRKLLLLRSVLINTADFLRKQFTNPLPRIFPAFHRWSKFRRHFVQNMLIGIVIEVLVHLGAHWHVSAIVETQNSVLDSMMKLSADTPSNDAKRPTQVFIDVDEQTYRSPQWGGGEPGSLPLDKIANLIQSAYANGARYALVDFAIDGTQDERQNVFISRIAEILKHYPQNHLLFVRTLRQPLEPFTVKAVRPSALDVLIAKHPNNVHAVAPNFLRSIDHVVRHWRLWESACYPLADGHGEGHWVIVPSPQMMIASLENNQPLPLPLFETSSAETKPAEILPCAVDGAEAEILDQAQSAQMANWYAGRWVWKTFHTCYQQDSFTSEDCGDDVSAPTTQLQNDVTHKHGGEALANRILFHQSDWVRKNIEAAQQGRIPTTPDDTHFFRLPAINLLTGSMEGALSKLKNASQNETVTIAVIGASYEDSRDTHLTPLGEMPGSLILVNAIDTMQTVGILQSPDPLLKFTIIVLTLVSISTAFALLSTLWASVLMVAIISIAMGPLSFWFLKQGIWLDFGAPIMGIYLHREWEGLLERRSKKTRSEKGETKCN